MGIGYGGLLSDWSDPSNSYPEQSHPAYVSPPPDDSSPLLATQQRGNNRLNDEGANLRAGSASPPPQPEEVHKFRDRHLEQIEDYAIAVGFHGSQDAQVLLAHLDIPSTTKVNADRGSDFQLPGQ